MTIYDNADRFDVPCGRPSGGRCTNGSSTSPGCSSSTPKTSGSPDPLMTAGPRPADRALPRRARRAFYGGTRLVSLTPWTDATRWPGTATRSVAARARTPWWRSSPSVRRATFLLRPRGGGDDHPAPARPRRPDRDGRLVPTHLGARRSRRPLGRSGRGSVSSSGREACASSTTASRHQRRHADRARHGLVVAADLEPVGEQPVTALGQHRLGVELHPREGQRRCRRPMIIPRRSR